MLKLNNGISLVLEVSGNGGTFFLEVKSRVGHREKVVNRSGPHNERDLWIVLGRYADNKLATLGLEETR
jgi:hypothetical protein